MNELLQVVHKGFPSPTHPISSDSWWHTSNYVMLFSWSMLRCIIMWEKAICCNTKLLRCSKVVLEQGQSGHCFVDLELHLNLKFSNFFFSLCFRLSFFRFGDFQGRHPSCSKPQRDWHELDLVRLSCHVTLACEKFIYYSNSPALPKVTIVHQGLVVISFIDSC